MHEIIVTDRRTVERGLAVRQPYILISIREPDKPPVNTRHRQLCVACLELAFHDAEPVPGFIPLYPIVHMTEEDARAIWTFVRQHCEACQAIVVHCEQGVSRSPAVAAALAKVLGSDEGRFWREYQPNRYVYELMLRMTQTCSGMKMSPASHTSNP